MKFNVKISESNKSFDQKAQVFTSNFEEVQTVGSNGKDGVSCTHKWNGTILTVTSASGTSSANLEGPPGKDGKD